MNPCRSITVRLLLTCMSLFLLSGQGKAQAAFNNVADSVKEEPQRYIVRVQRLTVNDMQVDDTLLVTLESQGKSIAGFDFKLGTDSRFISIVNIIPGDIYDSCGWEYFRARQLDASEDRPASIWQAVALSKFSPDTTRPKCLFLEGQSPVLKVVVANRYPGQPVPDTTAPIFFYWEGCTDNVLSDASGNSMIVSLKVFDYLGSDVTGKGDLFPSRTGAPNQCFKPGGFNMPTRAIEFHNGGIVFKLDTGPVDSAGAENSER